MPGVEREEEEEWRRGSGEEMDERRREAMALEYLRRLEEARVWLGDVFGEEDWEVRGVEMEEELRSGVPLARLAHHFAPKGSLAKAKVFDPAFERYRAQGLHFRHTDNTSQWIGAMRAVGLPEIFIPDTSDVYDGKNLPKAVFCLHALAIFLHRKRLAPPMRGAQADFTQEEVSAMAQALAARGINLPKFDKVAGMLAEHMTEDDQEFHLAIAAVNQAVDEGQPDELQQSLHAPAAKLHLAQPQRSNDYLTLLQQRRTDKITANAAKLEQPDSDIYDRNLTRDELQAGIDSVNIAEGMAAMNGELRGERGWEGVWEAARDPGLRLPSLEPSQGPDLYTALCRLTEGGEELRYAQLQSTAKALALAQSLSAQPQRLLLKHSAELGLANLQPHLLALYASAIEAAAAKKAAPLSPDELQALIDAVNRSQSTEAALGDLETLLTKGEPTVEEEREAWGRVSGQLRAFYAHLIPLYSRRLRSHLAEGGGDASHPTMEQLQSIVDSVKAEEAKAQETLVALRDLNEELALERPEPHRVQYHLDTKAELLGLDVQPRAHLYASVLRAARQQKAADGAAEDWLRCELDGGGEFFAAGDASGLTLTERPGESRNLSLSEVANGVSAANASADFYAGKEAAVVRAQAAARMGLARRRYRQRLGYLASQEDAAKKIQGHMRRRQAGLDWRRLLREPDPPLPLLRKFLRSSHADYESEEELQRLRAAVSKEAAVCATTDQDLHEMDVKIGLLVNNVINLEEVLRHGQKIKAATDVDAGLAEKGDKEEKKPHGRDAAFRRTSRRLDPRLEMYQQLVYLLQTQPAHLSRVALAKGQSPQAAARTLVMPVFGYASGQREEFLLCKLLQHSVGAEVEGLERAEQLAAASVPATVVSFTRQMAGEEKRSGDPLGALMRELMAQSPEHINIDPLEIYKYVVGEPKKDLTPLAASQDPKVSEIFQRSLEFLEEWTARFVSALCGEDEASVPYPVRLCWRTAEEAAGRRWKASAGSRERVKLAGRLWLELWVRPKLLAPEDHGLLAAGAKVSEDQRQVCASIARLLSFSVDSVGFGDDSAHLAPLNDFIRANHSSLKAHIQKLLQVPEPEEHYGLDELSDLTAARQPSLSISLGALLAAHQAVASSKPPQGSEVALLLKQLGSVPNLQAMAGIFCEEAGDEAALEKRSVTLHLRTPAGLNGLPLSPESQQRHKFLHAKALLREILLSQGAADVPTLLASAATAAEEAKHRAAEGKQGSLEERKAELAGLLEELEELGLVSEERRYQELVSAMAEDVKTESAAREARAAEVPRFQRRLQDLRSKKAYQREQAEAYAKVIEGCLASLNPKGKEAKGSKRASLVQAQSPTDGPQAPDKTLKYPGDKLYKKGVLLDLRDVPQKKWGEHKFEVGNNAGGPGLFEVRYRIGDRAQERKMNLQELLKLEYDGVETVTVFSGVVFALSPLLLLLNRKFHC